MPEKKFGETPLYGMKSLFGEIKAEKEKEGFKYSGVESLTSIKMGNDHMFREVPTQTLEEIEVKYKKLEGVKEVKLMIDPRDADSAWVFLKTK